jgi:LysM repeat protein
MRSAYGWMREQIKSAVPQEQRLPTLAIVVSKNTSPLAKAGAPGPVESSDNTVQGLPQGPSPTHIWDGARARQAAGRLVYGAKSGDTLTKIARLHGPTVSAIRLASELRSDRLALGQKIVLPERQNCNGCSVLTEGLVAEK